MGDKFRVTVDGEIVNAIDVVLPNIKSDLERFCLGRANDEELRKQVEKYFEDKLKQSILYSTHESGDKIINES